MKVFHHRLKYDKKRPYHSTCKKNLVQLEFFIITNSSSFPYELRPFHFFLLAAWKFYIPRFSFESFLIVIHPGERCAFQFSEWHFFCVHCFYKLTFIIYIHFFKVEGEIRRKNYTLSRLVTENFALFKKWMLKFLEDCVRDAWKWKDVNKRLALRRSPRFYVNKAFWKRFEILIGI
jgi:hypothetical protein